MTGNAVVSISLASYTRSCSKLKRKQDETDTIATMSLADEHGRDTSARVAQLNLIAGMGSGALCKVIEYPFDTVKVLLQSDPTKFKGPVDCLSTTYRQIGIYGLYRGLPSPLLGAMLENSVLFTSYGVIKNVLDINPNPTLSHPNPMWKYLVSGK